MHAAVAQSPLSAESNEQGSGAAVNSSNNSRRLVFVRSTYFVAGAPTTWVATYSINAASKPKSMLGCPQLRNSTMRSSAACNINVDCTPRARASTARRISAIDATVSSSGSAPKCTPPPIGISKQRCIKLVPVNRNDHGDILRASMHAAPKSVVADDRLSSRIYMKLPSGPFQKRV